MRVDPDQSQMPSNMTRARWVAGPFFLIGLVLYLRPVDYFNYLIFAVFVLVGCFALPLAIALRPVDRAARCLVGFGIFFLYGPGLGALALDAAGFELEFAAALPTAGRWLEITGRTVVLWIPIAAVVAFFFCRRARAQVHEPLGGALLGLRLLACLMAPSALVAIGTETRVGGVGISVFLPVIVVAWSAGRLAWEPSGESRRTLLRWYRRSFAIVGATTLGFIAARIRTFRGRPCLLFVHSQSQLALAELCRAGHPDHSAGAALPGDGRLAWQTGRPTDCHPGQYMKSNAANERRLPAGRACL
jgi:hypothetical protein